MRHIGKGMIIVCFRFEATPFSLREERRVCRKKVVRGWLSSIGAKAGAVQLDSDEEVTPVEYKIDLPKSKGTVLAINHKTLGVGSNGCGPRPAALGGL